MVDLIRDYLPWLLSLITLWSIVLAGHGQPGAWLLGAANQVLWMIWIVASASWGLMPLTVALGAVYLRNHFKQG
ncbi:hypothetical protein [Ancylobacter rudongensis]|uniref:Uncharacterized protein n=1 Tax=Ancylobacter rudongensis TaxID=177413 RepID=A0A1G4UPE6_9HYPH|nr:hypothetical protein [Ancylobacter rudongensis]SCW95437.1 hypothetical protein SAMN05660859_0028 [Ancylobacter rudongensis]